MLLTRRSALAGIGAAGLVTAAGVRAQDIAREGAFVRRGTPQMTLGPFYPVVRPAEEDWDLTTVAGRDARAAGPLIEVTGRVLTESGRPVPGARIEIWQTSAAGRYSHPADQSSQPVDPNFQGSAVFTTDSGGGYRFRSVLPGPYSERQRHIHFDVTGRNRRLLTQMFFPGEPNERDFLYRSLRSDTLQQRVVAQMQAPGRYNFDVLLAGE